MSSPPKVSVLSVNCFLLCLFSLTSDQVYCYFKFGNGLVGGNSYCYYDNFFFGWYYRLATVVFFVISALLMWPDLLPPQSPFWRPFKQLMHFCLFLECEGIIHFIWISREIEYMVEDTSEQVMLYMFVMLAVLRWACTLFGTSHIQQALERLAYEHYGYSVSGHGITTNRTKMNQVYGWASQYLADYLVMHYFAYHALHKSYTDADQYTVANLQRIGNTVYLGFGSWFYLKFVRKEVTFYNFII